MPSSCSSKDVESALRARLSALVGPSRPVVVVGDSACLAADSGRQNVPLQPNDIAFM